MEQGKPINNHRPEAFPVLSRLSLPPPQETLGILVRSVRATHQPGPQENNVSPWFFDSYGRGSRQGGRNEPWGHIF